MPQRFRALALGLAVCAALGLGAWQILLAFLIGALLLFGLSGVAVAASAFLFAFCRLWPRLNHASIKCGSSLVALRNALIAGPERALAVSIMPRSM